MIDYRSNDSSREIISELCPSWEIRDSRNQYFDSVKIDEEVMEIESGLSGWRMALNVTEFLYGNYDHFCINAEPTQYFVGNYVFVDMQDADKGAVDLDLSKPIHTQRIWGYDTLKNTGESLGGAMGRMNRSIHNHPVTYTPGRHFGDGKPGTFDDLAIFYYGWVDQSSKGVERKLQIKNKIGPNETHTAHDRTSEQLTSDYDCLRTNSRDLTVEIAHILEHNRRITGQEW